MKGHNQFTPAEIKQIEALITLRLSSPSSKGKSIRDKMRAIGFYGSDFGITGMNLEKFHNLIKTGKIEIIGGDCRKDTDNGTDHAVKSVTSPIHVDNQQVKENATKDLSDIIKKFKVFDPSKDKESILPDNAGNYIVLLRDGSNIPDIIGEPTFTEITVEGKSYRVLYTGISSQSLRTRDYKTHFHGSAGRSTLRKSLGSLFGYRKIPRDKNNPSNGKTKFNDDDELTLSKWMNQSLILMYYPTSDCERLELQLIKALNPPLNLKDNDNAVNSEFRNKLSALRKR